MEHRHYARIPIGLDMLIYRRGMPIATGRIRDASRGGVFIETDCVELREYQDLEIEFRNEAQRGDERQRVAGHVMRCANNGVALEIDDTDRAALHAMISLLGAAVASPHYANVVEFAE